MPVEMEHPVPTDRTDPVKSFSSSTLTIIFGSGAALLGVIGIVGLFTGNVFISGVLPEFKPISVSAALSWIFFGLVLVVHARKPLTGIRLNVTSTLLIVIAFLAALELPLNLTGRHFLVEELINRLADQIMSGQVTYVSPVATLLIILSAVALFCDLHISPGTPNSNRARDIAGITAFLVVLMSFTVLLSYGFGAPFLYKSTFIPIAFTSALAAFLAGLGLISTAGSSSLPLRYLTGPSIRSRLLRFFLPLIAIIILVQGLLQATLVTVYQVDNSIEIAIGLMLFGIVTVYVVGKAAEEVGRLLESEEKKSRKAEALLLESEVAFRSLAENANDGILVAAGKGIHVFANRRAAEITGYSVDELLRLTIKDLAHPDEYARRVRERHNNILAGRPVPREYETVIVRKDGTNVPIEVTSAKTDWKGQSADLVVIRDISKRKQAEEALRESEHRFRSAFELAAIGMSLTALEGRFMKVNRAFTKMTGYSEEEILRFNYSDITHPEDTAASESERRDLLFGNKEVAHFAKRYVKKDGRIIWAFVSHILIRDENNKPQYFVTQIQDITEQKQAEDTLRKSEEQYRTLFENILEGFAYCRMIFDEQQRPVDFIYLNVNRSFDRIVGANTVTGKRVTEVFPGIRTAFPQLFEAFGRVVLTGHPESFDLDFKPLDKWLHISVYSQQKEYFVAIFEDITEQKRAEEKIKISELRYRRLFESAKDGILILDQDTGKIIDANPFIETLLGYAPKDLLGKPIWEIGFFKDQLASKVAFEELQAKEYIRYEDLPLETKNGQRKEVEFVSNVYPIDHTSVIQCNIRDITDRKKIEYQREALIQELEQKNAELERFTYTVSHDLRSPLITIHGFSGLLETDIANNDAAAISHDLDRINTATTKMEELLHDLINLSRIGRIVNTQERVSFTTIAQEAVELLELVIGEKKVHVVIDQDMPIVRVDRTRVREAVMNLVENAVKFMGDQQQPEIRIGVEFGNHQPVFFVRDNGIGIDPKYFGKIFNLFEKLDVKKEGSGVGLAIVKRIIEIQGGRIWVESAGQGRGSTFRFTLSI